MKTILLRFAEIHLKGKNKKYFLDNLYNNTVENLKKFELKVVRIFNRLVVTKYNDRDESELLRILQYTPGISSISLADEIETSVENITKHIGEFVVDGTFRVDCNRADKTFPFASNVFDAKMGEVVLNNNSKAKVDLTHPDTTIHIDIRENGTSYIYINAIHCVGGLPLDRKCEGLLMLSGGIDSPVAGFCVGKRGLRQDILHFNSYPYTSPLAKEKVITLAQIIKPYIGAKYMYVISMTHFQEEFRKHCKDEYAITLLRKNMYRVAEKICDMKKYKAIVTGENLGQVASQTLEGLTVSNSGLNGTIVLRPLIAYNKQEIVEVAERIGTFNTSILPYEDCCTVFLPKNPATKPKVSIAIEEEKNIDIESLVLQAISNMEIIKL